MSVFLFLIVCVSDIVYKREAKFLRKLKYSDSDNMLS